MKTRHLVAAAGSLVGLASAAHAADMAMKTAPAPLPVPTVDWSGWYAGVSAGANWQQVQGQDNYTGYPGATASADGFIGGGLIGYNWQNGNAVYGLEGDISGLTGSTSESSYGWGYRGDDLGTASSKIDWLSTIRGRMGLAVGNSMAYATGGLAIGGVKTSLDLTDGSDGIASTSHTNTRVGWTVGTGVDQMWGPHWIVGLEGLFVDLGKSSNTYQAGKSPYSQATITTRNQAFIGRFVASYKW